IVDSEDVFTSILILRLSKGKLTEFLEFLAKRHPGVLCYELQGDERDDGMTSNASLVSILRRSTSFAKLLQEKCIEQMRTMRSVVVGGASTQANINATTRLGTLLLDRPFDVDAIDPACLL